MVHILTNGWYPPHKFKELIKVYMSKDKPAYPDFVKKIHHWAKGTPDGQYKTIAIYECPDDKLFDALKAISKRYAVYAAVEGYRHTIEPLIDAEEAIKLTL